jgi:hypothetical protein
MGTILALLVFLGGAIAVIAIGTRISVYFYTQDALGVHSWTTDTNQSLPVERNVVEQVGRLHYEASDAISSRYAWSGLAVMSGVALVVVIAAISVISGFVH